MARKIEFTPINTSLENLQLQANANNLLLSELYYVTDYEVLAQATSLSTFKLYEIPTTLSELTDDATHRLVTDTEKTTWNGKADQSTTYTKLEINNIIGDIETLLGAL